jgi:phage host-nuclease inhibitor protein Gam
LENRREYIDKMAAKLKELESEISELGKMADKAVAEVKAEYHQQIQDLFLKKEELQKKVSKISEASGNAWEDMKSGSELSWEVYEDSVKNNLKKKK